MPKASPEAPEQPAEAPSLPAGTPEALEPGGRRLDADVAKVWVRTLHELAARELLDVTDPSALERYARAQARVELLDAQWAAAGRPFTSARATGATMAHPLVAMIERADAAAAKYAADLQLTTAARLRTGYDKPGQSRLPGMPGAVSAADAGAPPRLKVVGE